MVALWIVPLPQETRHLAMLTVMSGRRGDDGTDLVAAKVVTARTRASSSLRACGGSGRDFNA